MLAQDAFALKTEKDFQTPLLDVERFQIKQLQKKIFRNVAFKSTFLEQERKTRSHFWSIRLRNRLSIHGYKILPKIRARIPPQLQIEAKKYL